LSPAATSPTSSSAQLPGSGTAETFSNTTLSRPMPGLLLMMPFCTPTHADACAGGVCGPGPVLVLPVHQAELVDLVEQGGGAAIDADRHGRVLEPSFGVVIRLKLYPAGVYPSLVPMLNNCSGGAAAGIGFSLNNAMLVTAGSLVG
jgi:hypothetical protein